jgi:hypothetical protein
MSRKTRFHRSFIDFVRSMREKFFATLYVKQDLQSSSSDSKQVGILMLLLSSKYFRFSLKHQSFKNQRFIEFSLSPSFSQKEAETIFSSLFHGIE